MRERREEPQSLSPSLDTWPMSVTLPTDLSTQEHPYQMLSRPRAPLPDAVTLCHNLVPLLKGPVPPALGHICFLEGFLQLLAQCLTLLSKDFHLFVGSPSIHGHRVFDLRERGPNCKAYQLRGGAGGSRETLSPGTYS